MFKSRKTAARAPWRVVVATVSGVLACADDPFPPSSDTTAPDAIVTYPQSAYVHDSDGDGLVNISATWPDSDDVALQSVRLGPAASLGINLLESWRIERFDSTVLVIEETVDNLLPKGEQQLVLTVPDHAGNARSVTIDLDLPAGIFHKALGNGLNGGFGTRATVCDGKVYVTDGAHLHIANATTLEFEADSFDAWAHSGLYSALCIPGDPVLYVTSSIDLFDRQTQTWQQGVPNLFTDIIASRADPDVLYAGARHSGRVYRYSRAARATTGMLPFPASTEPGDVVTGLAALPGDAKIYVARYLEGNLYVLESASGTVRRLQARGAGRDAIVKQIVVGADNASLFVAVQAPTFTGLMQWDVGTDTPVRELRVPRGNPVGLAIGADGTRLFLTTLPDATSAASNYLIDIPSWRIVAEIPRIIPPGAFQRIGFPAFRGDGRVVFVPRNGLIDVYLNRN